MADKYKITTDVLERFKQLAKDLNITVICATQAPRSGDHIDQSRFLPRQDIIFIDYMGILSE